MISKKKLNALLYKWISYRIWVQNTHNPQGVDNDQIMGN